MSALLLSLATKVVAVAATLVVAPVQDGRVEPTALAAEIAEVTVYSGSASVRRSAELPRGGGAFVVRGLPRVLDPSALRVRTDVGEVVGVELRERIRAEVPEARVQELRERVRGLERDLRAVQDERMVLDRLAEHLDHLARRVGEPSADEPAEARAEAWDANLDYLRGRTAEVRDAQRDARWRAEELEAALKDARLELGGYEGGRGVVVYDLLVDVFDPAPAGGPPGTLEIDTIVRNAGWAPAYDLRAPKDLSSVELVYRARVWQQTGEDWDGVSLLLSTAEPRRGAQGPDPIPETLSLHDPRGKARGVAMAPSASVAREVDSDGFIAGARLAASVESEGLSVRFRIPREETVESRAQPTTVLVGRTRLGITPEHHCLPAVDPTVWLRARAKNTSDWVMLPGRASVYFGADFVGHANLSTVRREEDFTVHLGPDPGFTVERTKLVDKNEEAGVFGSKRTLREAWRTELTNNGAFSRANGAADGAVTVIVHEVLPRTKDDRVKVEVERAEPKTAAAPRWSKLMEEKGVLTWLVQVPRGQKRRVELETTIAFPEDLELVRQ